MTEYADHWCVPDEVDTDDGDGFRVLFTCGIELHGDGDWRVGEREHACNCPDVPSEPRVAVHPGLIGSGLDEGPANGNPFARSHRSPESQRSAHRFVPDSAPTSNKQGA